jgi:outer membrane receptor protein involved in Fe transport
LLSYATPIGENVHVGASFVKSYYNNPSQFEETYDGFVFPVALPSGISETTNEARVFIGGNPSEKTSIELAGYFVNLDYHVPDPNNAIPDSNDSLYTDARYSYAAPRLGFVWRPSASIAIRAAAGGGFAEAPLYALTGSNGAPTCNNGTICEATLVNLNLRPETSFAFDFGTDLRLHQSTLLSFDAYRSNLYGQLFSSTTFSGTCPTCGGLPLYINQTGNLGVSRFEGIILELRHDVPRGMYWSLSGSLTRGYVISVPGDFYNTAGGTCNRATGANCTNLTVVPNINFNGTFDGVVPYAQAFGGFGYRWNTEKYVDLMGTYYGNNNTYFRPAFVELDGHVGYPLTKNVSLVMTFRNITGIYDSAIQSLYPGLSGAPTISGLPYPQYGEEYGPRTLILTTMIHI